MIIDNNLIAQYVGRMTSDDLNELANYLVNHHTGRAARLHDYISWAQQERDVIARDEHQIQKAEAELFRAFQEGGC